MQIIDDGPITAAATDRFHALIIVEETDTGDGRRFVENSLTWRDLPLPLMADDRNRPEHEDSVLIGNFDTIERRGTEIHGWGSYLSEPEGDAARLIGLVKRKELRGISADIDDVEFEVLFPVEPEPAEGEMPAPAGTRETGEDGREYEVVSMLMPKLRVTEGRVMGATVVPFQAFMEAFVEPEDDGEPEPVDEAAVVMASAHVTGALLASTVTAPVTAREAHPDRFTFPDLPPVEWFEVPEAPGPMPLTILDSGQVFGHLAVWGECHVGISGECVEPPPSATNYARFHVGEVPCEAGERVAVGRLTFGTGHAASNLDAFGTRAHYDDTGTVGADIVATDGEYGIWVCGAARSTLTTAQVREIMSSPPSGDWRRFGRSLELVGALCVNVPGYNTPRYALSASGQEQQAWVRVRKEDGLIASLIVSHPAPPATVANGVPADLARRIGDRIAASIGRSRQDRVAALAARVHGGR